MTSATLSPISVWLEQDTRKWRSPLALEAPFSVNESHTVIARLGRIFFFSILRWTLWKWCCVHYEISVYQWQSSNGTLAWHLPFSVPFSRNVTMKYNIWFAEQTWWYGANFFIFSGHTTHANHGGIQYQRFPRTKKSRNSNDNHLPDILSFLYIVGIRNNSPVRNGSCPWWHSRWLNRFKWRKRSRVALCAMFLKKSRILCQQSWGLIIFHLDDFTSK